MFKCEICGEEFLTSRLFSYHIRQVHKISRKDYYDKYLLDEDPLCPYCGNPKSFSDKLFKYRHTCGSWTCVRKHNDAVCYEKYGVSAGKKAQMTFQEKTGLKSTWQLEKTKESIKKTNNERYGCDNPQQNEEIHQKTLQTRIDKYGDTRMFGTKSFQEEYEKNCNIKYGVSNGGGTPEAIKKIKESIYKNTGHHTSWGCSEPYIYDDISFDSSWEVAFYIYHKENGDDIKRSEILFEYEYNGKKMNYYPDFELNGEIIEIKGIHFFEDKDVNKKMINPYGHNQDEMFEAKHQCMISNNVRIITDCSEYISYVENKYGKDYIKGFKNKKSK